MATLPRAASEQREQYVCTLRMVRGKLAEFSSSFLGLVFNRSAEDELLTRLRGLRDSGAGTLLAHGLPVADIDVIGDVECTLPLEYLFLDWQDFLDGDMDQCPDEAVGLPVITRWAMGFLGFSFNVRRIPVRGGTYCPQELLHISPGDDNRLGVRFYPHEGLKAVKAERAFFLVNNRHKFLLDEVDLGADKDCAVRAVGNSLGAHGGPPVHHFACHFSAETQGTGQQACFRLGPKTGGFDVPLHRAVAYRPRQARAGWIAFLNACETGSATSFKLGGLVPVFFGSFETDCLIGPEIEIPDGFASEFGRVFYAYWLRHRDIGIALFKARWSFLLRDGKPVALGLFYVCFASRPIRLRGVARHVFL